jgi:AcrR family transcriptional regulator
VFLRKGFEAATMAEVAVKARIAKGTLYLYFEDKSDLYGSLLEDKITSFTAALEVIAGSERRPRAKLEAMIDANMEFITGQYSGAEFFLHTKAGHNPEVLKVIRSRITPRLAQLLNVIAGVVKQGIATGEFRKTDPFEAAVRVFGLVNVNLMRRALDPNLPDPGREAKSLKEFVFNGISVPEGAKHARK